jgi:hypothetical protein
MILWRSCALAARAGKCRTTTKDRRTPSNAMRPASVSRRRLQLSCASRRRPALTSASRRQFAKIQQHQRLSRPDIDSRPQTPRLKVLQDANWRCQIAREDRCTGRATVYDHRIAVKMLDITPYAIRPTPDELDEPWTRRPPANPVRGGRRAWRVTTPPATT